MNIKQLKNELELLGGSTHFVRAKVLLYFTLQNAERHLSKGKLYTKRVTKHKIQSDLFSVSQ